MSAGMLIDECLSPELVGLAHESGFEAYHVAHYGLSGAKDSAVFEKVAERGFIFVTNNRGDFIELVEKAELHAGLIVIVPQVRREGQKIFFKRALDRLKQVGDLTNKILEVDENGEVAVYDLPRAWRLREQSQSALRARAE